MADKESRTPAEQKIESTLLHASRVMAGRPMAAGLAAPTPHVNAFIAEVVAPDKRVQVTVRGNVAPALVNALVAAGGVDIRSYPQYGQVTARLPIASVLAVAQNPDVQFIGPVARPMTNRMLAGEASDAASPAGAKQSLPLLGQVIGNTGSVTSQGVTRHAADLAFSTGINGAGVKVCVLSDGASSIAARQATGDLPPTIDVVENNSGDEGTAMMEIVYDMAPGVTLGFATAFVSDVDFANNIVTLASSPHNCTVIADDVSYDNEGAFQDGIIAQAVNTVQGMGVAYFSSAANSGNLLHGTSGTWEGDFLDGGAVGSPITGTGNVHNFGSNNFDVLNSRGFEITLQWSDPLGNSSNDYDLFVLNSTGTTVVASSTTVQSGPGFDPFEFIYPCNASTCPASARIVVVKRTGAAVRALRIDTMRGRLSAGTTGSTYGHNAAGNGYSVAAVSVSSATDSNGRFIASDHVESYSSDGPRKMFYNPNGTAITPGNVLFGTGGGTTLNKVDLSAADCGATSTPGFTTFCGTSAATPHAASIAALLKQAKPSLTLAQIKTALTTTDIDIETAGFDVASGSGIVMAPQALASVLTAMTATKSFAPNPIAAGATSVLTITLNNPNTIPLQGVAFTDTYPAGLVNAATPNPNITGAGCTGTLTATAGGNSLSLSAGVVPAGITCSYKVTVTSSVVGAYLDAADTVTTPIALNASAGAASLVVGTAPAITSAASTTFTIGSAGSLTVTATGNPAPTFSETGALPSPVTFNTITGVLSGTPAAGTAGIYHITFGATNGIPPDASQAFTLTVNPATSTTTLMSSRNPSTDGMVVTFTATVNGVGPTNTVAFTADATTISGCGAVAFSGGTINARTATCTTGTLSQGTRTIVANYSGDANNIPSGSLPLAQVVKPMFADFDGDRKSDILWYHSTTGETSMSLMNGVNVKSAATMLVDPNWQITQIGDFNGDGNVDLVWHNSNNGQTAIWLMNGTTLIGGGTIMADPNWTVTQVGDFNGDGKTDLLWHNSSNGQTAIWLMNGTSIIGGGTIMGDPNWTVTKVGDFNGDGKTDLLWRNSNNGQTAIWLMNGASFASGGTIMGDPNWVVTQVGDFDGDGRTDLLWHNSSNGQTAIWLMNGMSLTGGGTIMGDPNLTVTQVGDFNGDGKTDLVWRDSSNGQTAIWLMNGGSFASGQTILGDGSWSVTNVGDFDGDGKSDLIWRNSSTGAALMWIMNGASMSTSKVLQTDPTWAVATPQQ